MTEINLHLGDCVEAMSEMKDNAYDLAIVDPPYGIKQDGKSNHSRGKLAQATLFTPKDWDNSIPSAHYFFELMRVSKNQIIWGWNYFVCYLNDCPAYIVWDKDNSGDFSDCESAYYSKKGGARLFKWRWNGMLQQDMKNKEKRIHPTQKPVALYKWLLKNYAKEGDKILDTHLGSGSIAIACHDGGFSLDAWEIDKDYYNLALNRFNTHKKQLRLL